MPNIGLVGNGSDKFTPKGEREARLLIRDLLEQGGVVVSGRSPLGGIDIWAEEEAETLGLETLIFEPEVQQWNPPGGYGYRARNIDIAEHSNELHVILADVYPEGYTGRRFGICYHCVGQDRPPHVKSGGCWTGNEAERRDTPAFWHVVRNN